MGDYKTLCLTTNLSLMTFEPAFNLEKALIEAFSVIVKLRPLIVCIARQNTSILTFRVQILNIYIFLPRQHPRHPGHGHDPQERVPQAAGGHLQLHAEVPRAEHGPGDIGDDGGDDDDDGGDDDDDGDDTGAGEALAAVHLGAPEDL